jgi:hypothetical protein
MLWLTMQSDSTTQNEQTVERALILCFILVVATNVLLLVHGSLHQLSHDVLSRLHASLIQMQ